MSQVILDLPAGLRRDQRPAGRSPFSTLGSTPSFRRFRRSQELTICPVDVAESHELNLTYRGRDKPTNVLSFRLKRRRIEMPLLGDPRSSAESGGRALSQRAR